MCVEQADPAHRETAGGEGGDAVRQGAADPEGDDDHRHRLWGKGGLFRLAFALLTHLVTVHARKGVPAADCSLNCCVLGQSR